MGLTFEQLLELFDHSDERETPVGSVQLKKKECEHEWIPLFVSECCKHCGAPKPKSSAGE